MKVRELIKLLSSVDDDFDVEIAYTNEATDHWSGDQEKEDRIESVGVEYNTVYLFNYQRTQQTNE